MEKEFVTYELALRMKALGFDELCFNLYDFRTKELMYKIPNIGEVVMFKYDNHNKTNHISAPTWQSAFRWFREKYRLNSETPYLPNVEKYGIVVSDMTIKPKDLSNGENFKRGVEVTNNFSKYETPEEAQLACLETLIEIVENK
jgi:hypothetical protein